MSHIVGQATVAGSSVFESSADAPGMLGSKVQDSQGRTLRLVKAGEAITRGECVVAPAYVANHMGLAVTGTPAVGDEEVTVTLGATAVTANQYDGGTLSVVDDTGEGISYEILSHPTSDGSEDIVVKLKDPIKVAFGADTTVDLHPNLYNNVVDSAAITDTPVGIAANSIASGEYGWVVSHGLVAALANATITAGVQLMPGTSGGVDEFNDVTDPLAATYVGHAREDGTSGEHPTIVVTID